MKRIDKRTREYKRAVKGILAYYNAATEQDVDDGLSWYKTARAFAVELTQRHGVMFHKVVGIIAAMSANKAWYENKRIAGAYLSGQRSGLHFAMVMDKCNRIMSAPTFGEVCQILNGAKITSFARNIYGDMQPVTVDRHMLEMCGIEGRLTAYRQRLIQAAFETVALRIDVEDSETMRTIRPAELQAVTWCSFRRHNGKLIWGANL